MTWLRVIASRLRAVLTRQRLDQDFDDELGDHLELLVEEYEAAGLSRAEARRAAVLKLGHPQQLREANRDYRGMPLLESLAQDFGFALRTLRKSRGFTAVAVVTLALGIGLCIFLFSFLNGLLLRPLPGARDPERLAALQAPVTYRYFESYRDASRVTGNPASDMAAFIGPAPFEVSAESGTAGAQERISGHLVSFAYFSTMGVKPLLGRFFDPAAERPGGTPAVVVSERFWRMRLNADPHVAGHILRVNGQPATIVGVAQKGFLGVFPAEPADIFVPVTADAAVAPELADDVLHNANASVFRVVMRLAPKVTIAGAEAALDAQTRQLDRQNGKRNPNPDKQGRIVRLVSASGVAPEPPELRAFVLAGWGLTIALILSFTCANLAGLILARGNARGREIAIRLSVGAGRPRLIRQLLMESLLLALAGGAAGLVAAYAILDRPLFNMEAGPFSPSIRYTPDLHVALIVILISALTGIGFGLFPALAITRPDLVTSLKEISPGNGIRHRRFGLRNLFMVYQMAAAMLLVLMMGFAVIGIRQGANRGGPGFDTAGVYVFSLDPARDGYSPGEAAALLASLPERLGRLNGVEGVTLGEPNKLNLMLGPMSAVSVDPYPGARQSFHKVEMQTIGPGFFATLRLRVLRGSEFGIHDLRSTDAGSMLPVVINQSAAKQLFGDADPLGRLIRQDERVFQVTGVAQYEKAAIFQREPVSEVFLPVTVKDLHKSLTVIIRMRKGLGLEPVRSELKSIDSRLTVFGAQTLENYLAQINQALSYITAIYGGVGMFALILACVGLAGVTAQAVVKRRKEIGIRMALGARRPQVLRLVMRDGAAMVLAGSALGIAGAAALVRVVLWASASFAEPNRSAFDAAQFVWPPLLLVAVAAIACYLPARRSATIDPLTALREE